MKMGQPEPAEKAVISDDRAQYKKNLNNFLTRDTKNKKGAGKAAGNDYSSGETDSNEDQAYTQKLAGKDGANDKKMQRKMKIFDDDDENDGDPDGSSDESGSDEDESYED